MPVSQIQHVPTNTLRANPSNPRTHSKRQIRQVAASIKQVGFTVPIVVDENNVVLAGHGRLRAAQQLGLTTVPVVILSGVSEARRRAYAVADNKLTENAGWDRPALAAELDALGPLLSGEGLDIQLTGFEPSEIDSLMSELRDAESDPSDESPAPEAVAVSRLGDMWLLGDHRLVCGDARQEQPWRALMKNRSVAAMCFADPPYNVRIRGVQGRGKIKHREFSAASGEMTKADFVAFLDAILSHAAQFSQDGAIHYVCIDWRHLGELQAAVDAVYTELKNVVVWNKTNAGQGSFYRSQHELIFVCKVGEAAHINNFELGQKGRSRSNVWTYAGINTFRSGRMAELAMHPTVKPVALVADAMRDCSRRGDIVLDPFMGSGTTIVAAERVGRRAYGLEIDPIYVDVTLRRWQAYTGKDAVLSGTRKTFDEITVERARIKRERRS